VGPRESQWVRGSHSGSEGVTVGPRESQ
jgi:hypothetical protein